MSDLKEVQRRMLTTQEHQSCNASPGSAVYDWFTLAWQWMREQDAKTKPCVFCGKELQSAKEDWSQYQPSGGGEVQFVFAFGSSKFDLDAGCTRFRGIVCDECGEKLISRMDRS